jgi:membrane-bound metal-dependent hydrolase YbcI (DUF457 family)
MPSPIGHALGGLIVGLVGTASAGSRRAADRTPAGRGAPLTPVTAAVWCATAAMVPDMDFLWGRHNMETHSLGAAALAGVAVLAWTRGNGVRLAWLVAVAWSTHVLFDWLGSDDTPPLGVMALWPVTSNFYFAHAYVFEAISRRTYLPNFWSHNAMAVVRELAILGPLAALAAWRGRASRGGPR